MKAKILNGNLNLIDYDAQLKIINDNYKRAKYLNGVDDYIIEAIKKKKDKNKNELELLQKRKIIDSGYAASLKELNTYDKDFVPYNIAEDKNITELDDYSFYYEETETQIIQKCKIRKNNAFKVNEKIEALKKELSSTDYIIVKTYEAKLSFEDAPYSQEEMETIIKERKMIRNRINELQDLLNKK